MKRNISKLSENEELCSKIQSGKDSDVYYSRLFEKNKQLFTCFVDNAIDRFLTDDRRLNLEDLTAEAERYFRRASETFCPEMNCEFMEYARMWIETGVRDYVYNTEHADPPGSILRSISLLKPTEQNFKKSQSNTMEGFFVALEFMIQDKEDIAVV